MMKTSQCMGTILVIDNDEGVIAALSTRLESMGYVCKTAQTGAQGLDAFDSDVDLVVTDLNMPTLDGIGLVTKIRKQSDVPIIVMTGFRKEYARTLRRVANVTVLEKPFNLNNFLELIEMDIFLSGGFES